VQGDFKQALAFGLKSLSIYKLIGEQEGIADDYFELANTYLKSNKPESALYYAKQSLQLLKN